MSDQSVAPEPLGAREVVWCDVCTGVKRPASSSCLTCTASYCPEHELPHRTSAFYAKHPLMDPRRALEGRTCPVHRRLLEVSDGSCGVQVLLTWGQWGQLGAVGAAGAAGADVLTRRCTAGSVSAASAPSASWRNTGHIKPSPSRPRDSSNR